MRNMQAPAGGAGHAPSNWLLLLHDNTLQKAKCFNV